MGATHAASADVIRKPAETLPEHPSLDAAIAALDLSPPPALKLAERAPATPSKEASGLELAPPASSPLPIVPVVASSFPPARSSFGRDIDHEHRVARRNTMLLVATIWTFAIALVGVLLFMIQKT